MNHTRSVSLYTWWQSAVDGATYCLVNKFGRDSGSGYRITTVVMLEHLDCRPIHRAIDEFWQLVDSGELVELLPS